MQLFVSGTAFDWLLDPNPGVVKSAEMEGEMEIVDS
jgi:hypothetical protein